MNEQEKTFFLVWREGSTWSSKRHPTRAEARTEAQRLADTNPGAKFYVMQACSVSVTRRVDTTELDGAPDEDPMPF